MIVLDASLMIARVLHERHAGINDDLYDLLDASQIVVPCHWPIEFGNALRTNVRRGRITLSDVDAIIGFLSKFELTVGPPIEIAEIGALAQLAIDHGLTAYDAAYVRLALEQGARLATVDRDMRAAAQRLDIPLLPA
ncbi:MAG TPA: type II toxin-antitoxin system VapC family toxin [Xanthobacteraceae bacterium]